jgi:hypothetical protein
VSRLRDGDLVVYHPRWWRPLSAAVRWVPWFLFKRLKA